MHVRFCAQTDRQAALQEKLERLLQETAEVAVELSRVAGAVVGIPHDSVIESRAHELGRQLSRQVRQRQMGETAASAPGTARCPECKTVCKLTEAKRPMTSIDGTLEIQEAKARCPVCRRDFFPHRETLGFDARQLTPLLVMRGATAIAQTRSFQKASQVMADVAGQPVSAKTLHESPER